MERFYPHLHFEREILSAGKRTRKLAVSLAYTPPVRSTRTDYKATRIEFKLVAASSLEEVQQRFDNESKGAFDALPEKIGAHINWTRRSRGTVQTAAWHFQVKPKFLYEKKLFVVVTRNDFDWAAPLVNEHEKYSLAVIWRDTENADARLYAQIRQQLTARARQRARAKG